MGSNSQTIKDINSQALKRFKAKQRKLKHKKEVKTIALAIIEHQRKYGDYIL